MTDKIFLDIFNKERFINASRELALRSCAGEEAFAVRALIHTSNAYNEYYGCPELEYQFWQLDEQDDFCDMVKRGATYAQIGELAAKNCRYAKFADGQFEPVTIKEIVDECIGDAEMWAERLKFVLRRPSKFQDFKSEFILPLLAMEFGIEEDTWELRRMASSGSLEDNK